MDVVRHNDITPYTPEISRLPSFATNLAHNLASQNRLAILGANRYENNHGFVESFDGRMVCRMPTGMEFIFHICMADTEVGPP